MWAIIILAHTTTTAANLTKIKTSDIITGMDISEFYLIHGWMNRWMVDLRTNGSMNEYQINVIKMLGKKTIHEFINEWEQ